MQTFKTFYQKRFDGTYGDGLYDIDALMRISAMKEWLRDHKKFKYLEVGTGTGRFAGAIIEYFKESGSVATEVCFSDMDNHLGPEALIMGIFSACELGAEALPYPDKAFDLVVCNHVLEHVFETENALRDLRRVTAPGGLIVLGVPNIANWYSRFMFLFGFMPLGLESGTELVTYGKGPGKKECKGFTTSGHIRGFTARALEDICDHCGLELLGWWNQGIDWKSKLIYRYIGTVARSK